MPKVPECLDKYNLAEKEGIKILLENFQITSLQ